MKRTRTAAKAALPATIDCPVCTKAGGISPYCSHCGGHGWQVLRAPASSFAYYSRPGS